jgi:hypothetical protein
VGESTCKFLYGRKAEAWGLLLIVGANLAMKFETELLMLKGTALEVRTTPIFKTEGWSNFAKRLDSGLALWVDASVDRRDVSRC